MSTNSKDLRKQLRTVVKEMLPEFVNNAQYKQLETQINAYVKVLEENMKKQLLEMQERQKDTLSYLVRQVSTPADNSKK